MEFYELFKLNKMYKREKNKLKNNKKRARRAKFYENEAEIRVRENQTQSIIESWAIENGLKYETLKDLVGLKFN